MGDKAENELIKRMVAELKELPNEAALTVLLSDCLRRLALAVAKNKRLEAEIDAQSLRLAEAGVYL